MLKPSRRRQRRNSGTLPVAADRAPLPRLARRPRARVVLPLALVVLLVSLLWSATAFAKKPLVVGEFGGPFAADFRANLRKAFDAHGTFAVVKDAATEKVGYAETKKTYRLAAEKFRSVGIVVGEVETASERWSVKLAVYGPDGSLVQKFRLRAETADALNTKARQLVPKHVAGLLEDAEPAAPPAPKPKPPPPAPKPKPAAVKKEPAPAKEQPKKQPEAKPKQEPQKEPEAENSKEEPEAEPEEEPEDEADSAPTGPLPSPFELGVGFGYTTRSLAYAGDATQNLRISNSGAVWGVALRSYPGALFMGGVAGHLGLQMELVSEHLSAPKIAESVVGQELKLRATGDRFFIGPRARIPIGEHEIGIFAGYNAQAYRVIGDEYLGTCPVNTTPGTTRALPDGTSCALPDVLYKTVRFGVDARFWIDEIMFGGGGGYRILIGAGEIESVEWFSGTSGAAIDVNLRAGYRVVPGVFGQVGLDYTLYSLSFDLVPPERASMGAAGPIATGASDTFITVWVGGVVVVPGS